MTLVELLVAFAIFIMLLGALVSLTTNSLATWATGEARKEVYDRAQGVLETLARDLRNVYIENDVYDDGAKQLQPPAFACDADKERRQRLRFVRTGDPNVMRVPMQRAPTIVAPMYYGQQWEVAYVMDPDPSKNILWRGVRGYDRRSTGTLLRVAEYDQPSDPLFTSCFRPVETGVLHLEFRFWTQYTSTWDTDMKVQRVAANSKQAVGPETRWDSMRQDRSFYFYKKSNTPIADASNPDFVYPEIVQIVAVIESSTPDQHGIRLSTGCDDRATTIVLTHTDGLPDAPGMVKVEGEWLEYGGKTYTDLTGVKRGARGTAAQAHPAMAPVHHGLTFTTDVRVASYREAHQP